MTDRYGFSKDSGRTETDAPEMLQKQGTAHKQGAADGIAQVVRAGQDLGFVDRHPDLRRRPGPRRREAQERISIPGPKRVIEAFRQFCDQNDVTFWQGLELLLEVANKTDRRR